jgi:catalase
MGQQFVRYSPDVEKSDPGFSQSLQTVLVETKRKREESIKAEGLGRAVRTAHGKGYGMARGELEILSGVATEYAQGIYARPGRHEALVRFSNGQPHLGADAVLGQICGVGLKIFDVDGPTLLEDEPDSRTFDYAMINAPIFFANTIEHYVFINRLFPQIAAAAADDQSPEAKRARVHRFLHDWVTGMDTLSADEWAWEELAAFLTLAQTKPVNLLLSTYWTMGAVRHGDYIAKVRVAPVKEFADRVTRRALDLKSATEVFGPALIAELKEHPYEFDVQVQLCADLTHMPVDDVTVAWPEALSPFVTVAKLRLPQQDIGGPDNFEHADATSMTPWRVTQAHRPLGNIMRARKEVYRQSSIERHELNHQARKEPRNLADAFGS